MILRKIKALKKCILNNKSMNINENILRRLADYVMLNACSVSSSGLYSGKSGMALSLFETAVFLHDEYIEEQAFQTFQEALLTRTKDISFENGLCGIGYVLIYLIRNAMLEADLKELFGDNLQIIYDTLEKETNSSIPINGKSMRVMYFLRSHFQYNGDKRALRMWNELLYLYGRSLINTLNLFKSATGKIKYDFLFSLEVYLELLRRSEVPSVAEELIDTYLVQYEKGVWTSRYNIGYALYKIASESGQEKWKRSSMYQIDIALREVNPHRMSLMSMTDFLFRFYPDEEAGVIYRNVADYLFDVNEPDWSSRLSASISTSHAKAGYQAGISRLLLGAVNELTGHIRNEELFPL